jgi:hypothetical protein
LERVAAFSGSGGLPDDVTIPQMVAESNAASAAGGGSSGGCVVAFQLRIGAQIAVLSG